MSFFGKKTTKAQAVSKSVVMTTGGKVDDIVSALIENANDSNKEVKSKITESLKDIGRKQPELVLSSCIQFIKAQGKGKREHVVLLLHLVIQLLEFDLYNISEQLAIHIIQMALGEMTKEKNVEPEWQGPAAVILVTVGRRFPQPVWTVLVELFPPGSIPHYFVIKTMGDLATANPNAIVPNLKEVMARALPILGQIKKANIRWVFASSFGRWCDAVLTYLADADADKSITQETFSSEVYPAYEVIFNNWMGTKEDKVRLACVNAVGQMCAVMPREQFDSQLARIIPVVLKLYGKEKKHLLITQGLSTILSVACEEASRPMMEPLLNITLGALHPLLCSTIAANSDNPEAIKNTNELLRCFEIMAAGFPELLCSYLLGKLDITKVKSSSVRAGTLNIVKHLVTRLDEQLADKKELILAGVRPLVDNETSLEVRKVLCQVVIAMASQGYLQLEGGQRAIDFVIKQSAITKTEIAQFNAAAAKKKNAPDITPEKLRSMCDNVLHLATTTVPAMSTVLWPYLFEFIIPPQYTEALHIVCKCLGHIARNKRETNAPDYLLDFDKEVNLPKPPELIVRLLVMLNEPLSRGNLGSMILSCLQSIGPVLNPIVCNMWDNAMPKLAQYIEANAGTPAWDSNTWEDLTLRLLSETIKITNDEEWTQSLGDELSQQLQFYEGQPNVKKCAMKHMGLILQKLNRKEFIKAKLDMIFENTNHANEFERQGCAQAFGFCSASHLDIVLDKIKTLSGPAPAKKSGGFFSMFSGGGGGGGGGASPQAKQTLFLCLGYVASYASPKLVLARLDSHLLHTLEPYLNAKSMKADTKEVLTQAIDLVAKALHPSHLQEEYTFRRRDEFIELLINYMAPSKEVTQKCRTLGLNTCSTLIHLDPAMSPELEEKLIKSTMKFYYERAPVELGGKVTQAHVDADALVVEELQENFNEMLAAILYMDCSTICLGRIFDILMDFLNSTKEYQRVRVIGSMQMLLKKFIEFKSAGEAEDAGIEDGFAAIGKTLGLLVPRCTDPEPRVRMSALESIELIFFVDNMLRTSVGQDSYNLTPPKQLQAAHELRGRMEDANIHEQFLIVHQISAISAVLLPAAELTPFLVHSIKGLNDPHPSSSSGTCVMLNGMIKIRGEMVTEEVPNLVDGMLKAMESITDEKTMNGTLHSLRTLAVHHLLSVVEELLLSPTPHSQNIVKSIQVIVKDPNLGTQVIDHLTDIINNSQILEENTSGSKPVCTHAPRALSATAALGEIFELEEMEDVVNENFSQIFCSLLLRFGTTRYGKTDQASKQIYTTFQNFVTCAKLEAIQEKLDKKERWAKLETNEDFHYTITDIINVVCKTHPDEMNSIYEFILPYLQGNFTGQRIVTAAAFAEMIRHIKNDQALLQQIINNLLTIMVDQSLKLMTIRGLGNIADAGKEEVNRFSSTVIDALMCSIDADDEVIAMEAMRGLAKVFELVDESCVAPILVNICHRIRPAFEKDHEDIRSASFNLFGTLHRFGNDQGASIFYEQIHNNFPALFLHVNDESELVRKACKKALKNFAPLMKAQPLVDFFNDVLDEERELNYNEFLNRLSAILIEHFPERLNFYVMTSIEFYKSHWTCLRVGAAAFTGFALGNVPAEKKHAVGLNPSIITAALIGLLKQKSPDVRAEAAAAMSLLHHY